MRFVVSCPVCSDIMRRRVRSEFPDRVGAEGFAGRHQAMTGHTVAVTPVFDTPHEGLLT